eukprot:3350670-Heterocapsa_arctica.AAC.1
MKLLFAARLCRPDILVAITRLAAKVPKRLTCHDRALTRLMQYVEHSADVSLHGSLRASDMIGCKI